MLRVGVLLSGRGSNLQALIDACREPNFPAKIVHVVSNVSSAQGLERAQRADIPATVLNHRDYDSREAFDRAVTQTLVAADVELVCLAGFMRILSEEFVTAWNDRLLNIHPSLLPSFKGLDAQQQALDAGVKLAGCTVHFVRAGVDDGPIVAQAAVAVQSDDDEAALSQRILAEEHRIYPMAVRLIAEGRVTVVDDRVRIDGAPEIGAALSNPKPA